MKLRNQLLTLSLAALLVPWFGWKLVQELELFLRAGQESALLASARTVAQALPAEFQASLSYGRDHALPVRMLDDPAVIDGYQDDWPEAGSATTFASPDGGLRLDLMAAQFSNQLYLFCRVHDATPVRDQVPTGLPGSPASRSDGLQLVLRSARGLVQFNIHTAAPGPLLIDSQTEGGGQLEGYWLDQPAGYSVELRLPPTSSYLDISIGAVDVSIGPAGEESVREAGTLAGGRPQRWLTPSPPSIELAQWLATVIPAGARAWVVDTGGWVMAETGSVAADPARELSWVQRILYRLVAGGRTELLSSRPDTLVRMDEPSVRSSLAGQVVQQWAQDPDNAIVRNTVAVPIRLDEQVRGAVIMEASTDGMLLVTNRALGRLLLSTLVITVVLATGLWFFATRLSRRVQRLSGAVSQAMDDAAHPRTLPLTGDQDELGELARNNARLLRAVADYTSYLQNLASRLSHELKTPLAITRSSLDNLGSHDLDEEAQRYLARAREGLDRQAAIVRAMSEASRLEAAIHAAEWQDEDLAVVLRHTVEAYRGLYPGRDIELRLPEGPCRLHCAPDLLVQALDKLVDNAIGLTGPDDRVAIELRPAEPGWEIEVRNSGTRLPETLRERLFDSLVSVRERGSGAAHLGLGLYIVRLVAEAHGGTVQARNLEGGAGVAFTLRLAGED